MIIAISRESGCGGHEIGLRVSKRLNIPFYDKVSLKKLAETDGINTNLPELEEEISEKFIGLTQSRLKDRDELALFINKLIKSGDCVIVGRCSDHIANTYRDDVVSFFIHADEGIKIARMMERRNISANEAKKRMKKIDANRKLYFERYTDKTWRDAGSYNFSLDSGYLGLNGSVDAIIELTQNKLRVSKCFD